MRRPGCALQSATTVSEAFAVWGLLIAAECVTNNSKTSVCGSL